jgi:hypothetical protein
MHHKKLWIIVGPIGSDYDRTRRSKTSYPHKYINVHDYLKKYQDSLEKEVMIDLKRIGQVRKKMEEDFYFSLRNEQDVVIADAYGPWIKRYRESALSRNYAVIPNLQPPPMNPNFGFWKCQQMGLRIDSMELFDHYLEASLPVNGKKAS